MLGDVCELYQPHTLSLNELDMVGPYPVYGANGIIGRHSEYNHEQSELVMACRGATCGVLNITKPKSWINGNAMVIHPRDNKVELSYLVLVLTAMQEEVAAITNGAAQPQITRTNLSPLEIPLPPLSEQRAVVERLESQLARAERVENLSRAGAAWCAHLRRAVLEEAFS